MGATHKKTLTIGVRPAAMLTNQPIWLIISGDTDIGARAQSDASDVRLYTTGGVELSWRIVSWDITAGECNAILMAVAPSILSSADHQVELHYGGGASTPAYSSTLSLTGLVGAWDMEATSPGDWSGNGLHASSTGAIAVTGKVASALEYDGTDDYTQVADASGLRLTGGGTIAAWIKPDSAGARSAGRIADKGTTTTGTADGWALTTAPNGVLSFRVNAGTQTTTNTGEWSAGTWSRVVATIATDGARRIWVNGVDKTATAGDTQLPPNTTGSLRLGNRSSDTDRPFDGLLDDLRILSRQWSAEEIAYDTAQTNSPGTWGAEVAISGTIDAESADLTSTCTIDQITVTETVAAVTADLESATTLDQTTAVEIVSADSQDLASDTTLTQTAATETVQAATAALTSAASIDPTTAVETVNAQTQDLTSATLLEESAVGDVVQAVTHDLTSSCTIDQTTAAEIVAAHSDDLTSAGSIDQTTVTETIQAATADLGSATRIDQTTAVEIVSADTHDLTSTTTLDGTSTFDVLIPGAEWTVYQDRCHWTVDVPRSQWTVNEQRPQWITSET